MDEVLRTESLSKNFGPVCAVEKLSVTVRKGEIYGFLGLNGAGKTTTIRMLLGMIRPSAGAAYLLGRRVHAGETKLWRQVGYLVEIPYSYPDLTVRENLEITRRLRFLDGQGWIEEIIERLKLSPYRNRKARSLSTGNAQRLGLAKALMHRPEVLVLDEPANGLDPAGIVDVRELLRDLAVSHGVTIFISSHILGEIARMATRIGIIHEGRLVQELNTDQLDRERRRRLLVRATDQDAARHALSQSGFPAGRCNDGTLQLTQQQVVEHPDVVAGLLVRAGCPPTMLRVEVEDLESYFLRAIGRNGAPS